MAKTVRDRPRRPSAPGTGAAAKGPRAPSARARGGAAGRTARLAGLFATRRRRPGAGRGRRRPSAKALLFAAVGATIVAAMAWALLGSRLLVVRSVQVVGGGRAVPVAQVLAAAHVRHGMPLIRVNTGAIARQVEQLRQVQFAQVSKDWPSTVMITVTPRTAVFAVRVAGGYALVDRFGVSIRDVASQPAGLPLLSVSAGAMLRGNPTVRAAAVVLTELPPRIAGKVRGVSAPSSSAVSLTLANGSVVVWGNTAQAKQKAEELTVLMHRHARSYDVSGTGTAVTQG
jgi:cell division protein FtsQ